MKYACPAGEGVSQSTKKGVKYEKGYRTIFLSQGVLGLQNSFAPFSVPGGNRVGPQCLGDISIRLISA